MNSRRISQTKKRTQIALVTAVCLLLLFLVPKLMNVLASTVIAPVQMTKAWFWESGNSFPQYLRNRTELLNEIQALQKQLAESAGERHTIKTLSQENDALRSLLGYDGEERILAGVIGRPGTLPYDVLMIDQGTHDGVQEGAPVYIGDNTVIGVVRNATTQTALVELVTTPNFEATVYIIGPNIYTNAVGMGGGQLRVGVPQGIALETGDMVVLPSVASGIYGEISTIQSAPSGPEQYGFVSPHTPIASIRFVSVGTRPMQTVSFEAAQEIVSHTKEELFSVPVPEGVLVDTETGSSTASSTASTTSLQESS